MKSDTEISPYQLLEALLAKTSRSQKAENLKLLHQLCEAQHSGTRDFSLAVIGKLWEIAGGIKARALYNAASEDYRVLIKGWEDFSGTTSPPVRVQEKNNHRYSFINRIEDPAVRALVQAGFVERDKLEREVNLLKSLTTLTIYRGAETPKESLENLTSRLPEPSLRLTNSERLALEKAISPNFFQEEGWSESRTGSVEKANGRTVFDHGFTKAIRKVLETSAATSAVGYKAGGAGIG